MRKVSISGFVIFAVICVVPAQITFEQPQQAGPAGPPAVTNSIEGPPSPVAPALPNLADILNPQKWTEALEKLPGFTSIEHVVKFILNFLQDILQALGIPNLKVLFDNVKTFLESLKLPQIPGLPDLGNALEDVRNKLESSLKGLGIPSLEHTGSSSGALLGNLRLKRCLGGVGDIFNAVENLFQSQNIPNGTNPFQSAGEVIPVRQTSILQALKMPGLAEGLELLGPAKPRTARDLLNQLALPGLPTLDNALPDLDKLNISSLLPDLGSILDPTKIAGIISQKLADLKKDFDESIEEAVQLDKSLRKICQNSSVPVANLTQTLVSMTTVFLPKLIKPLGKQLNDLILNLNGKVLSTAGGLLAKPGQGGSPEEVTDPIIRNIICAAVPLIPTLIPIYRFVQGILDILLGILSSVGNILPPNLLPGLIPFPPLLPGSPLNLPSLLSKPLLPLSPLPGPLG